MVEEISEEILADLIAKSREVQKLAYCPYSKFRVGAALLCLDGSIFTGCNVENASYGLGVCAERGAIQTAIANGHTNFKAIVISCPDLKDEFIAPCGACRQFSRDLAIYMLKPDKTFRKMSLRDILPLAFTPDHLLTGNEYN